MFNSSGQASSVFNILIAGVVALAILGILMSLLGGVAPIQGKVIDTAQELLKDAYSTPYTIHTSSKPVIFDKGVSLTRKAITSKNKSLVPEQVCFSGGTKESFFDADRLPNTLKYKRSSSKELTLSAYCGEKGSLQDDLDELMDDGEQINVDGCCDSGDSSNGELSTVDDTDMCCVIFPVKPTK